MGGRMKASEILRQAARLVERGEEWYGCFAIDEVAGADSIGHEQAMGIFKIVAPDGHSLGSFWWGASERSMDARIIGLCLAAAIAESEGQ
jgi:hypothetical protein